MEEIRLAIPKMKRIWEFSALSKERDKAVEKIAAVERGIREKLANGTVSMEETITVLMP